MGAFDLSDLAELIKNRAQATSDNSYTRSLLDAGIDQICKKFGEESIELIIAAQNKNSRPIVSEAADVIYHMLVLLQHSNVALSDVLIELERRTAQSGHAEKASRPK